VKNVRKAKIAKNLEIFASTKLLFNTEKQIHLQQIVKNFYDENVKLYEGYNLKESSFKKL